MLEKQRPDKSAVGADQNSVDSASVYKKSNSELLNEIEKMLSASAEEMDTDRIEEYLSILQERVPVTEMYDPEEQWSKLETEHPLIFEEGPSPCIAYQADEESVAKCEHHRNRLLYFLRTVAISMAAVFCFVVTASALGFPPAQAVLHWAEGVIQVYTNPSGQMELSDDDPSEYHSLGEALEVNGIDASGLPTWIPRDYAVSNISVKSSDGVLKCSAIYHSDRGNVAIRVIDHMMPFSVETKERNTTGSIYIHNETEYYIAADDGVIKAGWHHGNLSYIISGQISEDEIKEMINSIQ